MCCHYQSSFEFQHEHACARMRARTRTHAHARAQGVGVRTQTLMLARAVWLVGSCRWQHLWAGMNTQIVKLRVCARV